VCLLALKGTPKNIKKQVISVCGKFNKKFWLLSPISFCGLPDSDKPNKGILVTASLSGPVQ